MGYYNKADAASWNEDSSVITEKQSSFLETLLKDRVATAEQLARFDAIGTKREASKLIGELLKAPKVAKEGQSEASKAVAGMLKAVETKPGYYVKGERVFQVVIAKTSGKPYAKEMVVSTASGKAKGSWVYAPGIVRELETLKVLTAEEAGVIGKKFGACMICGRTLTKQESIDAGIGPVCAGKVGY